jgi:magnesium chelatase family protein
MSPESIDFQEIFEKQSHMDEDFLDIKGQDFAIRALLIVAAGSHNIVTS